MSRPSIELKVFYLRVIPVSQQDDPGSDKFSCADREERGMTAMVTSLTSKMHRGRIDVHEKGLGGG